jgi:ferredoxin
MPVDMYPTYYIDPEVCIDCGACETECPNNAIYDIALVPADFTAAGGERISMPLGTPGFAEKYVGTDSNDNPFELPATRELEKEETIDLSTAVAANANYFLDGPGYSTQP